MIRLQLQRASSAGPRHGWRARACFLACATVAVLGASPGLARAQPVSAAETLLFETDHLARTRAPAALFYAFRKVSNVEPGFDDTVELDLERQDGHMHARLRFLSKERQRELPDIDDAHGNPVLLGFLERDIAEMKRLTGGSTTYFRKRIRMALANTAQLRRQPINFQGKSYDAQAISIQPYLDDPLHARFEPYVNKTYTFVLSEAVPGGVYQLSTSLGKPGAGRAISASAAAAPPATAGNNASALADASVAKRPEGAAAGQGSAAPDQSGPGSAGNGPASSGVAGAGKASTAMAGTGAAVAGQGRTGAGKPEARGGAAAGDGSASSDAAAARSGARAGAAVPGGETGGAPVIAPFLEETLTLVRIADPKR